MVADSSAADVRELFERADKNRSGALEVDELRAVFAEVRWCRARAGTNRLAGSSFWAGRASWPL